MNGPVVCLGESMIRLSTDWDIPLETARSLRLHVAGAESNVAVALARIGRPTRWISALPRNALGRFVATQIRGHGVDVDHVYWTDAGRVGLYFTELGGSPRGTDVIYDRQESSFATCSPDAIDWSALDGANLLHLTGITPALRPKGAVQASPQRSGTPGSARIRRRQLPRPFVVERAGTGGPGAAVLRRGSILHLVARPCRTVPEPCHTDRRSSGR